MEFLIKASDLRDKFLQWYCTLKDMTTAFGNQLQRGKLSLSSALERMLAKSVYRNDIVLLVKLSLRRL